MNSSERFAELIAIQSDDCALWDGDKNNYGYPRVAFGKTQLAGHVIACVVGNGAKPSGKEASHVCGVRLCVNPRHLTWETHAANLGRTVGHGTSTRGERHGNSKVTDEQRREIRRRYIEGRSGRYGTVRQADLAAEFGLSRPAVTRIVNDTY